MPDRDPAVIAVTLARRTLDDAEVRRLIAALDREMIALYPEDRTADHFRLDAEDIAPGRGILLLAHREGRAVGCGAVRRLDARRAEVKRMFVEPALRGRGVAGAILAGLEREARELGAERLLLETGPRQPAAIALYARHGFTRCGAFGDYAESPLSVFMTKSLAAPDPAAA